MSDRWTLLLRKADTIEALEAKVLQQAAQDLQDRSAIPPADQLEAFAKRAVEIALDDIVQTVSEWDLNSETFHDAYRMTLQKAHRKFLSLLSDADDLNAEENAVKQGRPEMPHVDTKHAEVILEGREPSHLREMYSEVMDISRERESKNENEDTEDTQSTWSKPKKARRGFFKENSDAQDD